MIGSSDVLTKISILKAYSAGVNPLAETFFAPLETAVNSYFTQANIETELTNVVKYLYVDIWRRNTVFEYDYPLNLPTNFPTGWADVRQCFYQFSQLMAISNEDFYAAWIFEQPPLGQPLPDNPVPISNTLIDAWIPEINQAKTTDKSNLVTLAEWCKNSEGDSDIISLLEERGRITSTLLMRQIAEEIYIARGVLEIIKDRNAGVYIPSYYKGV